MCTGTGTLTCAMAAAAMSWVTWNIEDDKNVHLVAFGSKLTDMRTCGFTRDMKLDEVHIFLFMGNSVA